MKKNKSSGLLAAVVLLAFCLALGCSNGTTDGDKPDDLRTSIYKQTVNGKEVEIEFSNRSLSAGARAVEGPATGDNYGIRLDGTTISIGKIQREIGTNYLTFIQSDGERFNGSLAHGRLAVVVPYDGGTLNVTGATITGAPGISGGGGIGGGGGQKEPGASGEAEANAKELAGKFKDGDVTILSDGKTVITNEDITLEESLEVKNGVTLKVRSGRTLDLAGNDLSGKGTVEVEGTLVAADDQLGGIGVSIVFKPGSSFETASNIIIAPAGTVYDDDGSTLGKIGPMFTIDDGDIVVKGDTITIAGDAAVPGETTVDGKLVVDGTLTIPDGNKLILADEESLDGKGSLEFGENSVLKFGDDALIGASGDDPIFIVGAGAVLELALAGPDFTITGGTVSLGGGVEDDPFVLPFKIKVGQDGVLAIGDVNITTNGNLSRVGNGTVTAGAGQIDGDDVADWLAANPPDDSDVEDDDLVTALEVALSAVPTSTADEIEGFAATISSVNTVAGETDKSVVIKGITVEWVDVTDNDASVGAAGSNDTFADTNDYKATITIEAESGFKFDSATVTALVVKQGGSALNDGTDSGEYGAALINGKIVITYYLSTAF